MQSRNSQKIMNSTVKGVGEKRSSLKKAEANLKFPEIHAFFQNIKLPQYYEAFVAEGFEEIDTLKEITNQHLSEMKIPLGHQIKIMKALKTEGPREVASSNIPKRTDLVELPMDPSEDLTEPIQVKPKKTMKDQETQDNTEKTPEIPEKNMRKPMKTQENQENSEKTLKHSNSLKPKSTKNVTFIEKEQKKTCDEGTGTSPRGTSSKKGPSGKVSCWNCFKLFEGVPLISYDKPFCSPACRKIFLDLNEISCEKCKRQCLKSFAIFRDKGFFCSEACLPKIEEFYQAWAQEFKVHDNFTIEDKRDWREVDESDKIRAGDLDLAADLKMLDAKGKEPVFLTMKEIEEKYKDYNEKGKK